MEFVLDFVIALNAFIFLRIGAISVGKQRSIFFKSLEKKKFIFPLVFCSLTAILLNTVGNGFVSEIRSGIIEQNFKIERFMQEFYGKLTILKYFFLCDVNKGILDLHKENLKLKYEIENLKHIKVENDELHTLLGLKKNHQDSRESYEVIVAKIISVFSNDYVRSYIINVGSTDGIKADDIVRNAEGFIGRICEVYENWSCVLAITDTNSKIPVKIRERNITDSLQNCEENAEKNWGEKNVGENREKNSGENVGGSAGENICESRKVREPINAILSGDNSNFLKVSMKNEDAQIRAGDIAETAYLENPSCNGIPVGIVVEQYGDFVIKPIVSFDLIQTVCVVKNKIF